MKHKTWLEFISETVRNEEDVIKLKRFMRYVFANQKASRMLVLYGNGANGKSVLSSVIAGIIPGAEEFVSRVNFSSMFSMDADDGVLIIDGKVLNISLGFNAEYDAYYDIIPDMIDFERMTWDFDCFDFEKTICPPSFIVETNVIPEVLPESLMRRMDIIKCTNTVSSSDMDVELIKNILDNKIEVFNWLYN